MNWRCDSEVSVPCRTLASESLDSRWRNVTKLSRECLPARWGAADAGTVRDLRQECLGRTGRRIHRQDGLPAARKGGIPTQVIRVPRLPCALTSTASIKFGLAMSRHVRHLPKEIRRFRRGSPRVLLLGCRSHPWRGARGDDPCRLFLRRPCRCPTAIPCRQFFVDFGAIH